MKKLVNVPVATVWTTAESARDSDCKVLTATADMEAWIKEMDYDRLIELHDRNLVQTQVLYGEEVIVTEEKNGWSACLIPSQTSKKNSQGYPGYIPSAQLVEHPQNWPDLQQSVFVNVHGAELVIEESFLKLSYGTILFLNKIEEDVVYVQTPTGNGRMDRKYMKWIDDQKADGNSLVETGKQFLGLPYLWAGNSSFGYDCSGFVYSMCRANGYLIPRDAGDQSEVGKEIPFSEMEPGDALFFAYEEGKGALHHVGLYAGEGRMLHSPKTGKPIEMIELKGTIYEKELCKVRRYAGELV